MVEMTKQEKKEFIARRAARFFQDGDLVNLGIGIPTLAANFIPEGRDGWIQSENGVIGLAGKPEEGKEDPDVIDASGGFTTLRQGGSFVGSFESFGLIRGGHVAATVLGAFQVDQEGSVANWIVPGRTAAGMGGAMDLVSGARQIIITMEHCEKTGAPKVLKKCTLPLTASHKVTYVVTELCVLHQTEAGLVLEELAPGVTVEDVLARTEAELIIPEKIGCMA